MTSSTSENPSHSVEVLWTIENASDGVQLVESILSKCFVYLDCLGGTELRVELHTMDVELSATIYRSENDDGPELVEVSYVSALLDVEGNAWKSKRKRNAVFRKGEARGFVDFADQRVLKDNHDRLLHQNCLRILLRLWFDPVPVPQPLVLYARSRLGFKRRVTFSVPHFSTLRIGEERVHPVGKTRRDDGVDLKVVLFFDDGELGVRFECSEGFNSVVLEEVSIARPEGLETAWKGKQMLHCFSRRAIGSRFHFLNTQKLTEDPSYLPDDVLTLVFELIDYNTCTVCHATPVVQDSCTSAKRQLESLSLDLTGLLEHPSFSDFTLRVGEGSIPVHKCILTARSQYFRAMLAQPMIESSLNEVQIPDFRIDTIRGLVQFLYSGSLPYGLGLSDIEELYSAADKYDVLPLRDLCSSVLVSSLTCQSAFHVLRLSVRHSDASLKAQVMTYMRDDRDEVFHSSGWEDLERMDPDLFREMAQFCRR